MRSRIKRFAVLSGKPYIDPETSMMKTYSRPGRSAGSTRLGGSAISKKKLSSFPSKSIKPLCTAPPASW